MKIVVDFLWQITECNTLSGKLVKWTPFYPLCEINENWGRLLMNTLAGKLVKWTPFHRLWEKNENCGRFLMADNRM